MLFMQQEQQQIQQRNQRMQLLIKAMVNSQRQTSTNPPIQTYDELQDLNVNRAQFNFIAKNQNWTDVQKQDELIPISRKAANKVIARLAENQEVITYHYVDKALLKICGVRKSQLQKKAQFYPANEAENQSEEDFARQVEILGLDWFPELSEERIQSQLFKVFVKGL